MSDAGSKSKNPQEAAKAAGASTPLGAHAESIYESFDKAGHGGVSGRYAAWRQRAFDYAWIIDAAGAHPSGEGPLVAEPAPGPGPGPRSRSSRD